MTIHTILGEFVETVWARDSPVEKEHQVKKSLKSAHTWKKSPYMEKAPMGTFSTFLINYLWPQKVVGRSIGRFLNKLRYIVADL